MGGKVPILKTIQKVPGGLMVVFLLLGAIVNTFAPKSLMIGSFTTALFKQGALPLIAVLLFCSGAQITIKTAGVALWKGFVLNTVKILLGISIGLVVGKLMGPEASLFGLTPLALIAAMANSNGGLYTALAQKYGDASDIGAVAIISTNDGPFFTMVAMGMTGLANIPIIAMVAVVVPIVIGMILGNLDEDMREFLAPGVMLSIPFFSFPLGAGLNLMDIAKAGIPGIALGLMTLLVTGIGGFFAYKYLIPSREKRSDAVGASIGTTAGNAAGTPAAIAAVDPTWAPYAAAATVQVGASIVITAILCPLLVDFLSRICKQHNNVAKEEGN
ncbi:2-keto-3-deoxygluconate permease [Aminivibrio sp.]|jgi:2-keto-3-deoxygluconate permease|uniref:2-keto-3-deoxygluconate permease n=1 Tax=Aminivibrio sp. TaxID=1872489 RepID=UPI001A4B076E|nr:2-keto-3-deoxygluconate permease [Aminivibrio sp.]MBL3540263.1 2-keto-3-deoxygluconate permease [Aminivibrio sp.]